MKGDKNLLKERNDQLSLPFTHDKDSLGIYFERVTGKTVSLIITDNSTSLISIRARGKSVIVRLQRIFLNAGYDVINEIAGFIKSRKVKTPLLREFIKRNAKGFKRNSSKKITVKTHGRYYNLRNIYDSVNKRYFENSLSCPITWGMKSSRYCVKKRTLGSYSRHINIIRINPLLDRKIVPRYFIAFVVYHEMLHADMGVEEKDGRRSVHSREFRKRERMFEEYERAIAWEKKWI